MNLTTHVGFLTGAAALTMCGVAGAGTEAENLQERIDKLESQLAELTAGTDSDLAERRSEEVRGLINDVLADADSRASLLQQDGRAGYREGEGFVIGDDRNRLAIGALTQVRWQYNNNDGDNVADEHRAGFENPNTRVRLQGRIGGDWGFYIQGNHSTVGGGYGLLDAYATYSMDENLTLQVGQFKAPILRETIVDAGNQLGVHRSLLHDAFTGGRTQGIAINYQDEMLNVTGSFNDGANRANTPAYFPGVGGTEWAFTGRVEGLLQGTWGQFEDFSSWDGEEMGILIGGAAHYEADEYGSAAYGEKAKRFVGTIDAQANFGNASLFGAFVYRNINPDESPSMDQWGLMAQGGMFFVPNEWEVFGRFEWGDDDSNFEDLVVGTLGVNRYFHRHNAKWSTDIGWNFNRDVSPTWSSLGSGWRPNTTSDRQFVLRSQVQLMF